MANVCASLVASRCSGATPGAGMGCGRASENLFEEFAEATFKIEASVPTTAAKYLIQIEAIKSAWGGAVKSATTDFFKVGAIAIISLSLFVVAQNIVGFLDTLKFVLRVFSGIFVGMVFERQFPMSFFDLIFRCIS